MYRGPGPKRGGRNSTKCLFVVFGRCVVSSLPPFFFALLRSPPLASFYVNNRFFLPSTVCYGPSRFPPSSFLFGHFCFCLFRISVLEKAAMRLCRQRRSLVWDTAPVPRLCLAASSPPPSVRPLSPIVHSEGLIPESRGGRSPTRDGPSQLSSHALRYF